MVSAELDYLRASGVMSALTAALTAMSAISNKCLSILEYLQWITFAGLSTEVYRTQEMETNFNNLSLKLISIMD